MKIIGITGSSGAGKSTICEILEKYYNVKVINADEVARKLSKKGTKYIQEIKKEFGEDILDKNGELKRKRLADIIYTDVEKRKRLNLCTFKYIKKEIQNEINKNKEQKIIIIDAPLLFEAEINVICDYIIGVVSERQLQIERIVARDGVDHIIAEKRLKAQENNEFYIGRCDEIIQNNNDLNYVEECIHKLVEKFNISKK